MRLVQVLISEGERASVLAALDGEGVEYAVFDEVGRGDFEAMVQFPVPPSGVEPVMEDLVEVGVREDSYAIVLPTFVLVSRQGVPVDFSLFPSIYAGGFLAAIGAPYLVRVVPNRVWAYLIPLYAFSIGLFGLAIGIGL